MCRSGDLHYSRSPTPTTKTCRWGPRSPTPTTKTCRWGPRPGDRRYIHWLVCLPGPHARDAFGFAQGRACRGLTSRARSESCWVICLARGEARSFGARGFFFFFLGRFPRIAFSPAGENFIRGYFPAAPTGRLWFPVPFTMKPDGAACLPGPRVLGPPSALLRAGSGHPASQRVGARPGLKARFFCDGIQGPEGPCSFR